MVVERGLVPPGRGLARESEREVEFFCRVFCLQGVGSPLLWEVDLSESLGEDR